MPPRRGRTSLLHQRAFPFATSPFPTPRGSRSIPPTVIRVPVAGQGAPLKRKTAAPLRQRARCDTVPLTLANISSVSPRALLAGTRILQDDRRQAARFAATVLCHRVLSSGLWPKGEAEMKL